MSLYILEQQYTIVLHTCDQTYAGTDAKLTIQLSDNDDTWGCTADLNENREEIERANQGYYESFTCPDDSIQKGCTKNCFIKRVQIKHNGSMWTGGAVCIKKIRIGDDTRGGNVFVEEYWRGKWINDGNRYIEFRASFRLPSRLPGNNVMSQAGKEHVQKAQDDLDEEAKKQRCAFDSGKGLGMMQKCGSGLKKKKMIKKVEKEKKAATKKSAKSIKE